MRSKRCAATVGLALAALAAAAGVAGAQPAPAPAPPPQPAPAADPGAAPPAAPMSGMDHDGVYVVGTDIAAGTYVSAGPVEGSVCYWKRMSDVEGGNVLENAMSKKPQTVRIDPTDKAFKTSGCQPWQRNDAAVPPQQPMPPWLTGLQLRHWINTIDNNARQSGNGALPPH